MKWLPAFLFFAGIFFFLPNYTPKEKKDFEMLDNGCVVHALQFKYALEAKLILEDHLWTRILAVQFYGKLGHAITVFVYKNNTFVYDPNLGTYLVASYPLYDPLMIAEICFPKLPIRKAYFFEPTFLLHYQYKSKNNLQY